MSTLWVKTRKGANSLNNLRHWYHSELSYRKGIRTKSFQLAYQLVELVLFLSVQGTSAFIPNLWQLFSRGKSHIHEQFYREQ
jgi:hypothetical protein